MNSAVAETESPAHPPCVTVHCRDDDDDDDGGGGGDDIYIMMSVYLFVCNEK